jgi:tetratricopeptide (TPR) repeat protein/tRNA A-37 threonylcarbamoyl transferase component Bud32
VAANDQDDPRGVPAGEPERTLTSEPSVGLVSGDPRAATTGLRRDPERYEIIGEHGRGGLGRVMRVRDRELGRDIAIKELIKRGHVREMRFLREALITARLEHPGIVPVHEAGRWPDGTPFYAMKLVSGRPLRDLIAERPVVEDRIALLHHVIAVADAIAYAHGRNIIHRDLKPANVIVGEFGETIVIDWGLAKDRSTVDDAAVGDGPFRTGEDGLTAEGTVLGTPSYMAPEQRRGEPVDQRGDVFAIGVMLWELCALERPADDRERHRVLRRARIARDLAAIIEKSLADDPADRYRDAGALAADLKAFKSGARIAARSYSPFARLAHAVRRHRALALSVAGALASAAAAFAISARIAPDACAAPTERLAAVWGPGRRAALGGRLAAVDRAQGPERFARIALALDAGAGAWSAMHVEACRATRVEGRQSDTLLDRRMECLDRWLVELDDTVGVIERAGDPAAIDHATRAATALSPLAVCADLHALSEAPPPIDAVRRATAEAVMRRAQAIDVERRASRFDGLPAQVRELVAEARALDHPPVLAAALAVRARVDFSIGDETDAEGAVRELAQVAARGRDDRSAAFAWTNLIMTLGAHNDKPDAAVALFPTANAAVLRAGDPPDLRAELLYGEAQVVDRGPDPEEALAMLGEARRVLERAGATVPGSALATLLANVVFETAGSKARLGRDGDAIAGYHDAIERWRALFGSDSPDEAFGWHNLGATLQRAGKPDEALAAFRTAARIREARLGDSALTAGSLVAVASVLNDQGQWRDALAVYDRALRIDRAALPAGDTQIAAVLIGRANTLKHLDRLDEAAQCYDDALALYDRAGARSINVAITLYNRGELAALRGRCDDALRDHGHAAALFEQLRGPTTELLIYPLVGEAGCLLRGGRATDAIPRLQRALALPARPGDALQVALARAYLGRALVETGRDRPGGLAMIRAARPAIAADATAAAVLRELDRWLGKLD